MKPSPRCALRQPSTVADVSDTVRIANCSGFYGDRFSAAREMVEGGPIDFLTGDYLAELTMALLWRSRSKDPSLGYATTFLRQMGEILPAVAERGIRVVSNAGGLNPRGLAAALEKMAEAVVRPPEIAIVDGDDILDQLQALMSEGEELRHLETGRSIREVGVAPVTANAYLGGRGIAAALDGGADIVVTGRVTDAALVIGPALHHHGWAPDQWDPLAGALVAGHIIECGAQTTGGNFSFFTSVPGLDHVGFPIVEIDANGEFTVTKHPGTGGMVTVETVTAQLLYEIEGPRYENPDVTARFDSIRLVPDGPDRVRVTGIVGEPPPPTTKVAINHLGGYRNSVTFVLTGLQIEEKAEAVERALWASLGGEAGFAETDVRLLGRETPDPESNEEAMARLRITVKDPDPTRVGRRFSAAAVELALAHYPGFFATEPPGDASPYAVYWPTKVRADRIRHRVTVKGEEFEIPPLMVPATVGHDADEPAVEIPPPADGKEVAAPLGHVLGARSGDKGGTANLGLWVAGPPAYRWMIEYLDADRLRELIPECAGLEIDRHLFPNLMAMNFVIHGLLGEGVASSVRTDPQAKSLGEFLRARIVPVPLGLIRPEFAALYHS